MNEVDVACLPADLPEFIEVDLKDLAVGQAVHVKDLPMPSGVSPVLHGNENPVVMSASVPRAVAAEEEPAAVPVAEVPAAKQAAKPEEGKGDAKGEAKGKGDKK